MRIRAEDSQTPVPATPPYPKIVREITLGQILSVAGAVVLFALQQYIQSERNLDKVALLITQASETNTRVKELGEKIDQSTGANTRQDEQILSLDRRVTKIEDRIMPVYTVRK